MKCAKCSSNIVFENNCLGLETLEVKCGNISGAMLKKSRGILCSVCSSSRHFNSLNSDQNITHEDKKMKTREFLRYFVGVLPSKYQNAMSIVIEDEKKFKNPRSPDSVGKKSNTYLNSHFEYFDYAALAAVFDEDF